jgi:hypothetical protein
MTVGRSLERGLRDCKCTPIDLKNPAPVYVTSIVAQTGKTPDASIFATGSRAFTSKRTASSR